MKRTAPLEDIEVVAPNFNRRLSGVTSTIARLVPVQRDAIDIVATGVGLPDDIPQVPRRVVMVLGRKPHPKRPFRILHARRNVEMLFGLALRALAPRNWRLVFTSASQREHTGYTKWLIDRMDAVIATSRATARYLDRPATVILHGIDTKSFQPVGDRAALRHELDLPEGHLVGCFGRVRRQKGTDLFVDTMIRLLRERPDWNAVVFGRATEQHLGFERELKARVAEAGLTDRILFPGEVPVDEIASRYAALDLFVAPQRWEGFGLTPLEAMACGVPVVATDVGAFPELLTKDIGTLVPRDDLNAMVEATAALMDAGERRDAMGRAARAHMEANFTIQGEAEAITAVYRRLWAEG